MDDLISRSETVAAICRLYTNHGKVQMGINLALDAVEEQPSVPAEVVRHGRWKTLYLNSHICSECNMESEDRNRYCPHCGARMDQGNAEQFVAANKTSDAKEDAE